MTLEKKQEFTLRISQANRTQMITIISEMVIDYLDEATGLMQGGKKSEADRSLDRAQSCIDELIHSLNLEYELAKNLYQIYIFSKKELMAAGVTGNATRIQRVKKNFMSLHEAYLELEKMDSSEKLMGNTQKVYAGLTYGRYRLNEDFSASYMNRGLRA